MSQLVLDDQLDVQIILPSLESRITAVRLQDLRPGEHIFDDQVPEILQTLKTPTFITIDHGFWKRRLSHPDYCRLTKDEQEELPGLLRRLFRLPEFRTRSARMGKVASVGQEAVAHWEAGKKKVLSFSEPK
jgi:hypothetical protein